jgi:hypothetical protein
MRRGTLSKIYTWDEISSLEITEPDFFIDPFIVREGITFLWGKWGLGKSPLTWWMAHAVGTGGHFFGLPARQGRVLYIDVDSPETVALTRLKGIPAAPNVSFLLRKPFIFPGMPREQDQELAELNRTCKPDVVFFNTLRKCHDMDDKDSRAPKMVYTYFQMAFPQAALVFVHHDKKDNPDPKAKPTLSETFSGSQAWINDAQVGLKLAPYASKKGRENLRLFLMKSQVSPKFPHFQPMPLLLGLDGSTVTSARFDDLVTAKEVIDAGYSGVNADREIARLRQISETYARKFRLDVENGKFPGSRTFLEKDANWLGDDE